MPYTDNPLLGLREAIDAIPGLRYADVRRWSGLRERAFQTYLAGKVPDIASQLALARFIAGQIVPRPTLDGQWEFIDLWNGSAPAKLAEVLSRLRDLVAFAGEPTINVPRSGLIDEPAATNLTATVNGAYSAPMSVAQRYDEPATKQMGFLGPPSQKRRVSVAVELRKAADPEFSQGEWYREAVEEKLEREGVPMPD